MNVKISGISVRLSHILFSSFIFRMILIPFFSDDFNFWAAKVFSNFWLNGFNPWSIVYNDPTLYWINPWRYPPPYTGFVAIAQILGSMFNNEIVFLYGLKLPLILADLVTVLFIYKIVILLKESKREAGLFALFYAFNPVTIFISSIWGMFEPIPVMFTVMALYYFMRRSSKSKLATSALLLGLGIAFKIYPIFILPAFLAKIRRLKEIITYFSFALFPIALFSIPFLVWDNRAYINLLLFHNVGGLHPLFPVFYSDSSTLIQIIFFSFVAVLFVVAYLRKTSLIANVTLSFFALYIALGGNLATYGFWMVPFATLLLIDINARKIRSLWLLPFFPMVSIVHALIYNGPYNQVEGVTGIYYWTYHWARQKVVVFRSEPFVDHQIFMAFASTLLLLNIAITMYFFIQIVRCKNSIGEPRTAERSLFSSASSWYKRNTLLLAVAVIALVLSMFITVRAVPFEPTKAMPKVYSNSFVFYDDFNSSLLNYQWAFVGDGAYTLNHDSIPSHILFNGAGTESNQTAIFRGWGPFQNGFFNSSSVTVISRFRFESLNAESPQLIMIRTDGGYLGVSENESKIVFNYFDDMENRSIEFVPVDHGWHEFSVTYNSSGRFLLFDNRYINRLTARRFSFLYLGNPEAMKSLGGSFSVDWIRVVIKDFPINGQHAISSVLAVVVPMLILLLVTTKLAFSQRSASPNTMRDSRVRTQGFKTPLRWRKT